MAGRLGGKFTVRWPTPGPRYDALNEAVFRNDLERLLDRLGSTLSGAQRIQAFADADATPSVANGDVFTVTNTGATTITAFDDGQEGQQITLIFKDGNTTVQDASIGGVIQLAGGANFAATADDVLVLITDGTNWYEVSRSVN